MWSIRHVWCGGGGTHKHWLLVCLQLSSLHLITEKTDLMLHQTPWWLAMKSSKAIRRITIKTMQHIDLPNFVLLVLAQMLFCLISLFLDFVSHFSWPLLNLGRAPNWAHASFNPWGVGKVLFITWQEGASSVGCSLWKEHVIPISSFTLKAAQRPGLLHVFVRVLFTYLSQCERVYKGDVNKEWMLKWTS